MSIEVDAVVVGGGPAGAVTAFTLAKSCRRVLLLAAHSSEKIKIGETLPPESREILRWLGMLEQMLHAGHLPSYGNHSAWASFTVLEQDFIFNPYGHGWRLDRLKFDQMLRKAAQNAGARVYEEQPLTIIGRTNNNWEIRVGTKTIRTSWLIDATGRRCTIARTQGVRRVAKDRLVSIFVTAEAKNNSDMDTRTFIESRPDGWWYSVLTPNLHRTVAFQTDADLLKNAKRCIGTWFQEQLNQTHHLSSFLARHRYTFNHPPNITSAQSARLARPCGIAWLAVGDASLSFDPLSGQGIFKAMLSGQKAAEVIIEGGMASIGHYETWTDLMWRHYLSTRNRYYVSEQRWASFPFWKRRHLAA